MIQLFNNALKSSSPGHLYLRALVAANSGDPRMPRTHPRRVMRPQPTEPEVRADEIRPDIHQDALDKTLYLGMRRWLGVGLG